MEDIIKIWIDVSISDLKASQLLYENKQFWTSYYHFQQSTEKANKAFALLTDQLTEKEFFEIGHEPLKIYSKMIINHKNDVNRLIQALELYPEVAEHEVVSLTKHIEYPSLFSQGTDYIEELKNRDPINISSNDLNTLLYELSEIRDFRPKPLKNPE